MTKAALLRKTPCMHGNITPPPKPSNLVNLRVFTANRIPIKQINKKQIKLKKEKFEKVNLKIKKIYPQVEVLISASA